MSEYLLQISFVRLRYYNHLGVIIQLMDSYDIVIVGGGLTGLALLDKISHFQQKVLLIDDSQRDSQPSSRPLVLTEPNAQLLNYKHGTGLEKVKVSTFKKLGMMTFKANEHGMSNFGYVVDARSLHNELYARNKEFIKFNTSVTNVEEMSDRLVLKLSDQFIATKLLVAADGANSTVSKCLGVNKILGSPINVSIIPNVTLAKPACAHLRFVPSGTVAFLPTGELTGTIVATGKAANSEMSELWRRHLLFTSIPQARINYSQDCFYLQKLVHGRVVFLGNSAHSLPPVGAQGFNLGCRGISRLVGGLSNNNLEEYSKFHNEVVKSFKICSLLASSENLGYFLPFNIAGYCRFTMQEIAGIAL